MRKIIYIHRWPVRVILRGINFLQRAGVQIIRFFPYWDLLHGRQRGAFFRGNEIGGYFLRDETSRENHGSPGERKSFF